MAFFYPSLLSPWISHAVRLWIKEYEKALAFAGQASDEVASMEKNLGVAHFKVCDLCLTELDVPATVASRMHAVSRDYR
jgi:hypothetical protein